jgi:hypothetical protein
VKLLKFVLPALILTGGIAIFSFSSFGKPEYTKSTKKSCGTCHQNKAPKDGKDLTAVGECYKEKKSLEGCTEQK